MWESWHSLREIIFLTYFQHFLKTSFSFFFFFLCMTYCIIHRKCFIEVGLFLRISYRFFSGNFVRKVSFLIWFWFLRGKDCITFSTIQKSKDSETAYSAKKSEMFLLWFVCHHRPFQFSMDAKYLKCFFCW